MATWQEMYLNDLARQNTPPAPQPIGFMENIRQGGWGGFFDRATFGIKPMAEAGMLYKSTKRFQLDDYPRTEEGWQQRLEDKEKIVDYLSEQAERAERGLTIPAKVGTVVFDMLPFMVEFITTGGLASLGKAGVKKSILKLARKYVSNRAARTLAGIGSTMASAGIRTALTPQHVAEKYFENRLPQLQLDENKNVIVGDAADTPATAIYKAVGDHFIELLSEESGAALTKMATGVMPQGVHASASKLMNTLRKAWIKAAPGRDSIAFAEQMAEKAGFHGILEEMGEERLGELLRATFNIENFGAKDGNVFDRMVAAIPDGQQLLVEALAFSVPGAAKGAAAVGTEVIDRRRQKTDKSFLLSDEGAKFLIDTHPDQARKIAAAQVPSRKELGFLGDIRLSSDKRAQLAESVRKNLPPESRMSVVAVEGAEQQIREKWGPNSSQAESLQKLKDYVAGQAYRKTGFFNKWVGRLKDSLHVDQQTAISIADGAMHDAYIEGLKRLRQDGAQAAIDYAQSWADKFNVPFGEGFLFGVRGLFRREAVKAMRTEQTHGKAVRLVSDEESATGAGIPEDALEGKKGSHLHDELKLRVRDTFERLQSLLPNYLGQNRIKTDDANYRIVAEIADDILADPAKTPLSKAEHANYLKTRQAAIKLRMRPFAAYRKTGASKAKLADAWEKARQYLHHEAVRRWEKRSSPKTVQEPTQDEMMKGITIKHVQETTTERKSVGNPLAQAGVPGYLQQAKSGDSFRWVYPDRSKTVLIVDPDAAEHIPGALVKTTSRKGVDVYRWMVNIRSQNVRYSRMLNSAEEPVTVAEAQKRRQAAWEDVKKNDKSLYEKIQKIPRKYNQGTKDKKTAIRLGTKDVQAS